MDLGAKPSPTPLAYIDAHFNGMQVSALFTTAGRLQLQPGTRLGSTGQLHPGHLIPGTLVIEQRARPKLADGEEPGPLQIVALLLLPRSTAGDICSEW